MLAPAQTILFPLIVSPPDGFSFRPYIDLPGIAQKEDAEPYRLRKVFPKEPLGARNGTPATLFSLSAA
jgi:hypothetical protein